MERNYLVRFILRAIWCVADNLYCIPAYLVTMFILLPLRLFRPCYYWMIEGYMFRWLLANVAYWGWTAGFHIFEYGDDLSDLLEKHCLVIANHQSTADVATLMAAFIDKASVARKVYWIQDKIFRFTNFGIVSSVHGDFFITQGKHARTDSLDLLRDHLKHTIETRDRRWVVLFPEGGFLRNRRVKSQKYARENNFPVLQHVALPHVGAVKAVLEAAVISSEADGEKIKAKVDEIIHTNGHTTNGFIANGTTAKQKILETRSSLLYLIDVTIAYEKVDEVDLIAITGGGKPPSNIHIFYRRFPISEVPLDTDELRQYLIDRFAEKEELLSHFYANGRFPSQSGQDLTPRPVRFSGFKVFLHNGMYLMLTAFYCWLALGLIRSVRFLTSHLTG